MGPDCGAPIDGRRASHDTCRRTRADPRRRPRRRGRLTAAETGTHVPFAIARECDVHDVTSGVPRGGGAHRDTDHVITAATGNLTLAVSDGRGWHVFRLGGPMRELQR